MLNRRFIIIIATLALLLTSGAAMAEQLRLEVLQPQVHYTNQFLSYQDEAGLVTQTPTIGVGFRYPQPGTDPAMVRWKLIPGVLPNGDYCITRYAYESHREYFFGFDDADWEPWTEWTGIDDEMAIQLPELDLNDLEGNRIYYLMAVQVMASDGSVSSELEYGHQVANFAISLALAPYLSIHHPLLGTWQGSGTAFQRTMDLLPGLDHGFMLAASANEYGSVLASVRWGWDVSDPDDPNDPNWAVPAGLEDENFAIPAITFVSGVHVLSIHALDTAGNETRFRLIVTMVPMPDPSDQLPLLLVDDVRDHDSNGWSGAPPASLPLDRDEYRDSFWNTALAGAGGVAGFDPDHHVVDSEVEQVGVRDLVSARVVLWTGRFAAFPYSAASQLRPQHTQSFGDELKYNWLGAYQENGGNLLYAGSRAATTFLGEAPYVLPIILDSPLGQTFSGYGYIGSGVEARVGLGNDPYGPVYERIYPYRNLGVAAVDVTSPNGAFYNPQGQLVSQQRKRACAGMKGLVLDDDFVASHMGGSAAFADTIWTEAGIDWNDDPMPESQDALAYYYTWGEDEFYDVDVMGRDIPVVPQECDGEACIEPLWRSVSRFDWIQQERLAVDPEDTWPQGYYDDPTQPGLDDLCGNDALNGDRTDALTSDQITAFVTRKDLDTKPSGAGDVVLGFDPYRFDHSSMTEAVQWILGEHFGLSMLSRTP